MAIVRSVTEPLDWSPPDRPDVSYRLRTPAVYDRARLARACLARGARFWSDAEMRQALIAGISAILAGDDQAEERALRLGEVERWQTLQAAGEAIDIELAATVAEIEAVVARHWPPYAGRIADRSFWIEIMAIEAARLLTVNWHGLDQPCATDMRGLTDAALEAIPVSDLKGLALQALALLGPDSREKKASDSRSRWH